MPTCTPCLGLGVRHIQYFLLAFTITLEYWIPSMTYKVFFATLSDPSKKGNSDLKQLTLSTQQLGQLEAMSYLAFSVGRITSGVLCVRTNNKYLLVAAVAVEIVTLTSCYFTASSMGFVVVTVCMSLVAFVRAFHWTLVMSLLSKWTPFNEFTTAMALICIPRDFLSLSFFSFESYLTYRTSRTVLIAIMMVYLVWMTVFLIFAADGPETSFLISKSEYHHLTKTIGPRRKANWKCSIPMKSFAKTFILYGWLIADFGRECAVKTITNLFAIALHTGGVSSVLGVQFGLIFVYGAILGSAVLSDKLLITKEVLTSGQVRKIYSSVGCCGISISMILSAYTSNRTTATTFLIFGLIFSCIASIGQPVSLFDLSPNYAATLFALLTFFRLIMFACKIYVDTRIGIYPITVTNQATTFDANLYRYGFLIFITNLIFLLCGDIEKKPFDSEDTYDWTKESIISYP